jgi:hypothetical protein
MGETAVEVPSMNPIIHPNRFFNTVPRTDSFFCKIILKSTVYKTKESTY